MISWLNNFYQVLGVSPAFMSLLVHVSLVMLFICLVAVMYFFVRPFLASFLKRLVKATKFKWDDALLRSGVLDASLHLLPGFFAYVLADVFFVKQVLLLAYIKRLALAYMIFIGMGAVSAVLKMLSSLFHEMKSQQRVALNSIFQFARLLVYVFGSILLVATLMDESPWAFISGLGALTAVIMLVFKDTLTGFVASVQLSVNRMVEVGDWIEMPKYGADGDVIAMSLTSIKVQNWDKTISTVPTSALVTDAFKNWRGMEASGGRRIKQAILLDSQSVSFCDRALIQKLSQVHLLADFFQEKQLNSDDFPEDLATIALLDQAPLTNVTLFRAYLLSYLKQHPAVHQEMTLLVRQLAVKGHGLPLECYFFSREQDWAVYESIQGDIMAHVLATLPFFELGLYQAPAGRDIQALAVDSE
eukprot:COSAG01_NODE_3_length_63519_cov_1591.007663_18_plen_416_part_00